jgi:hypothetical protein
MPLAFRILPAVNLVQVRYRGKAGIEETAKGLRACFAHPDFRPGMRHLVDVTEVTGFERDYTGFMRLQAGVTGALVGQSVETVMVIIANSPSGRAMAALVMRTWDNVSGVVIRMQADLEGALGILGVPAAALDAPVPWVRELDQA